MRPLASKVPFCDNFVLEVPGSYLPFVPWVTTGIAGIKRIFAGISWFLATEFGLFPLDSAPFLRYGSSNTPASPLPLVGEAHLGQVFLCADGFLSSAAEISP